MAGFNYMDGGFDINNPGLAGANDSLNAAVGTTKAILDDLNGVLQRMQQATNNSALPLWADLQNRWNGQYSDMVVRIENGHQASVDAHQFFLDGDAQSVRIMSWS